MTYFPPPHPDWQHSDPAEAGLDPAGIAAAARYAAEHETPWSRDLAHMVATDFGEEPPWNETLGTGAPRGGPNGLVLRGGRIVAEWGDTTPGRSDLQRRQELSVDPGRAGGRSRPDPRRARDGAAARLMTAGSRRRTTTRSPGTTCCTQTSEWEGELWGKPDLIDRHRSVAGGRNRAGKKGTHRDLQEPGSFWEYNDVRVNRLALALLRVWRRPLPEVFRELVMDPIGASRTWEWHGYRNSYVEIDGRRMQSVSGGSHWGGGVFIHARDQARIGLLLLRGGVWQGRRILSEDWIAGCAFPARFIRNTAICGGSTPAGRCSRARRKRSYSASGAGGNLTWIDPENDLVAVLRWIDPAARDGFIKLVMEAAR